MLQTHALGESADANFVVHATWIQRRAPGMTTVEADDLVVSDCGFACDTFNIVCRARLDPLRAPARVRETIDFFHAARHPFSWWLGPADRPAGLGEVLEAEGLERSESELAMAADLGRLRVDGAHVDGLRVVRVRTREALADFARINAANWTPPDPGVLRFFELAAPFVLSDACPLRYYVGYVGAEPVAASQATIAGGVIGLYNISTAVAHRRRGYGSVLTLAPLLDARADGIASAVLQASAEGAALYARLGFEPFGEITEYKPTST